MTKTMLDYIDTLEREVPLLQQGSGTASAFRCGQMINELSRDLKRESGRLLDIQNRLKKVAVEYCVYINAAHADEIKQQEKKG